MNRGISEAQHLQKIHINETYPELSLQKQEAENKKQLLASSKATIAFDYGDEGSAGGSTVAATQEPIEDEGMLVIEVSTLGNWLKKLHYLLQLNKVRDKNNFDVVRRTFFV